MNQKTHQPQVGIEKNSLLELSEPERELVKLLELEQLALSVVTKLKPIIE